MKVNDKKELCCGCGACANICPQNCIVMVEDEEGFMYPRVEKDKCIECGMCHTVCQYNVAMPPKNIEPIGFGAKSKKNDIENVSSAGVFSELALRFLRDGGVVYGASMTQNNKSTVHIRVDKEDDLIKLFGSKYLQSDTQFTYSMVKNDLSIGNRVLYSGTPCQILGLKLFLNGQDKGLYCVEVICHGVPSKMLWEKYLEEYEKKYMGKTVGVNFRHKVKKLPKKRITQYDDKIILVSPSSKDPYMQLYLRDYCLRDSCYNCEAKKCQVGSDLTLADFWGCEIIAPDYYDPRGVSLVIVHSEQGNSLFETIKENFEIANVDLKSALRYNPSYTVPAHRPTSRELFYSELKSNYVNDLYRKYCKKSIKERFYSSWMFRVLRRLLKRKSNVERYFQCIRIVMYNDN